MLWVLLLFVCFVTVYTQSPPSSGDFTEYESKAFFGARLSVKETAICETTPDVKGYSGYIRLAPNTVPGVRQNYPINTFFWYFSSREDPQNAPLSLWFNGGPGASSLNGLLTENGPCRVNGDSRTTRINPWSWNNNANTLYLDQPNQVGFSYDTLNNSTFSTLDNIIRPEDFSDGIPATNATFYAGTFPSQQNLNTANSTTVAAEIGWVLMQTWLELFPGARSENNKISIWAQSYGGKTAPAFMAHFHRQNQKIMKRQVRGIVMELDTLGIVNGLVDDLIQHEVTPQFAFENSYGIQLINSTLLAVANDNFQGEGGCRDKILGCRTQATALDPQNRAESDEVNAACGDAYDFCQGNVLWAIYNASVEDFKNSYDIALPESKAPLPTHLGYLMQAEVQKELGVPVNYTDLANAPYSMSILVGDSVRGGHVDEIAYLLDHGVRVTMLYGDRDYICNWHGGEAVSLAVEHKFARLFRLAGYEDVQVGDKVVGQVRQHAGFSFVRLFQAGHQAPLYQPEASYHIFQRTILGVDIATGQEKANKDYCTRGQRKSRVRQPAVVEGLDLRCYVLAPFTTCTRAEAGTIVNGTAMVEDYVLVGRQ